MRIGINTIIRVSGFNTISTDQGQVCLHFQDPCFSVYHVYQGQAISCFGASTQQISRGLSISPFASSQLITDRFRSPTSLQYVDYGKETPLASRRAAVHQTLKRCLWAGRKLLFWANRKWPGIPHWSVTQGRLTAVSLYEDGGSRETGYAWMKETEWISGPFFTQKIIQKPNHSQNKLHLSHIFAEIFEIQNLLNELTAAYGTSKRLGIKFSDRVVFNHSFNVHLWLAIIQSWISIIIFIMDRHNSIMHIHNAIMYCEEIKISIFEPWI